MPTRPATSCLAAVTQRLPGADDDVDAGIEARAVGQGGDGLGAAHRQQRVGAGDMRPRPG